jgi:hypothetical protein
MTAVGLDDDEITLHILVCGWGLSIPATESLSNLPFREHVNARLDGTAPLILVNFFFHISDVNR